MHWAALAQHQSSSYIRSLFCRSLCALLKFQDSRSRSSFAPNVMIGQTLLLEVAVAAKKTERSSTQELLMSQPANYTSHLTRTLLWNVTADLFIVRI